MYYYYGSESKPPCREEVFWQVFANPRSISKKQLNFLNRQIVKKLDGSKLDSSVKSKQDVYGNIRKPVKYSPNKRQPIKYNPIGSNGTITKTN